LTALHGFEASTWFGLLASTSTPPAALSRLQQETTKALNRPLMRRLRTKNAATSGSTARDIPLAILLLVRRQ